MSTPVETAIDASCRAILSDLEELIEAVQREPADTIFEIGQNAETTETLKSAKRLRESVRQYADRNADVFYIGLMGHFSSGKSSSLNSILQLWDTEHERENYGNPTDAAVTLVTTQKNSQRLINLTRQGQLPVRTQPISRPILENIVFMDTPGYGDPDVMAELVRDMLPLCDLVLYFFSAAAPLDSNDLPLLRDKVDHLPEIPIRFVITRADEFRDRTVDTFNIDEDRRDEQIALLVKRIDGQVSGFHTSPTDFYVVDNLINYGIDELRADLESWRMLTISPVPVFCTHIKLNTFEDSVSHITMSLSHSATRRSRHLTST